MVTRARLRAAASDEVTAELIPDRAIARPEEDRLGLVAVADTLAGLVTTAEAPSNVAVFGAWGSGKTSLSKLLEARLRGKREVRYVYINAWKYSEAPLRRHFLAAAGRALREKRGFTKRLYSKSRTTSYQFGRRTVGILGLVGLLAVSVSVLLVAGSQVLVWLPDRSLDYWKLVGDSIAANAGAVLVSASILSPVLAFVVNDMKVELNEDEPSSAEQFDELFGDFVKKHLPVSGRLVFFVDELDRARASQTHEVLETLKTFLDQPGCVFVVAADQVVLEEAILKAELVTVPSHGNPYYSGGSAYLDKVFQYQIQLPAFESRALTRFALELTNGRSGVWESLGTDIGPIVSVLVPSHIRSPRRVKVLLNNFVLAHRVAVGRLGEEALGSSEIRQLAKLVCLRTEFPLFYRDLEAFPSLVDAVTASVVGNAGRVADYEGSGEVGKRAIAYANGSGVVDIRLNPSGDGSPELDRSASDQLHDYLRRTREIVISDLSLIFLQPPGSQIGLEPSVARVLDRAASDGDASTAIGALQQSSPEVLDSAVEYLVMIVDRGVGLEINNSLRVLIAVAGQYADAVSEKNIRAVLTLLDRPEYQARLGPEDLKALLAVSNRDEPQLRDAREIALFSRAAEGEAWSVGLLGAFDSYRGPGHDLARSLLANNVVTGTTIPIEASIAVEDDTLRELWAGKGVAALATALADISQPQSAQIRIATAVCPRMHVEELARVFGPLLEVGDEARITQQRPLMTPLEQFSSEDFAESVLTSLSASPQLISVVGALLPKSKIRADPPLLARAVASLVELAGTSDELQTRVATQLPALKGLLEGTAIAVAEMGAALDSAWTVEWSEPSATEVRKRQHKAIDSLAELDPHGAEVWQALIGRSILAILDAPVIPEVARVEIVDRVWSWREGGPPPAILEELFVALTSRPAAGGDTFTDSRRYCLFVTASLLTELRTNQIEVLRAQLPPSAKAGSMAAACVAIYVGRTQPKLSDEPVPILLVARLAGDRTALHARGYFEGLREPRILELLVAMFDAGYSPPPRLLEWIRSKADEIAWATEFADRLRRERTLAGRDRVWRFLASLRLSERRAVSIAFDAAMDSMTDTAGSLNDLLAEIPLAFPGWEPTKKAVAQLDKARSKFADRRWQKAAKTGLEWLHSQADRRRK